MSQHTRPTIVVVGSINMDLVVRCDRAPGPGQTVRAREMHTIPGGKGANQAVAAARLGATCRLVGRVGDDGFGPALRAGLDDAGVDTRHVLDTPGVRSGVALIILDDSGENRILVVPGANGQVTEHDVTMADAAFQDAQVCLLQLELPLTTVAAAASLCRRHGVQVVLDPAPAAVLSADLWNVDVLSPNESEATDMVHADDPLGPTWEKSSPLKVAVNLQRRGARTVVLKLGAEGSLYATGPKPGQVTDSQHVPPFAVRVVDTTAAGDAFTAALGVAMAERRTWPDALRFANAAGALACTTLGAQPSLPLRAEVEARGASD